MGTQRKEKTLNKNYKQNGGYTHGGYSLGRLFCHVRWIKERGDVEYTKREALIINMEHRRHRNSREDIQ